LHKAIVIVYSRSALQPSGIRRFGIGVSQLSPLWPVLRNGKPFIELLGNALTFERVLQRPTPSHLWTTGRPRMRYTTCQQLPWRPAHGHAWDVAGPTKKPIVKAPCLLVTKSSPPSGGAQKSSCRCQRGPSDGKDYRK